VIPLFFHVLLALQDTAASDVARQPIKIPAKPAGRWIYTSITLPGDPRPLQIAALPSTKPIEGSKPTYPYLAFYCQSNAPQKLLAFLDARSPLTQPIEIHLNGKLFSPATTLDNLTPTQYKLPQDLTALLPQAQQLQIAGHTFLLLNWPTMQARLAQACR
jgi:hypothetical protein